MGIPHEDRVRAEQLRLDIAQELLEATEHLFEAEQKFLELSRLGDDQADTTSRVLYGQRRYCNALIYDFTGKVERAAPGPKL